MCVVTSLHSTTCTVVLLYVDLCVSTRSDSEQENSNIKLTIFKEVQVVHVCACACMCMLMHANATESAIQLYYIIYAGFNKNDRGL